MSADHVLDAWAALALLHGEASAGRVADLLDRTSCVMTWVNLAEVHYIVERRLGPQSAASAVDDLLGTLWRAQEVGADLAVRAAAFKAAHAMSLAGSFAAAAAWIHDVPLVTGDPELVVPGAPWDVIDLRDA